MAFLVKEIKHFNQPAFVDLSLAIEKSIYPVEAEGTVEETDNGKKEEVFHGYIAVIHTKHVSESIKDHIMDLFGHHQEYQIILHQEKPQVHKQATYILYHGASLDHTTDAFSRLQQTLSPLLEDGSVMITKSVLDSIILPQPISPYMLISNLIELMQKKPDGHPEWHKVAHSLLKAKIFTQECKDELLGILNEGDISETNVKFIEGEKWMTSIAKPKMKNIPLKKKVKEPPTEKSFQASLLATNAVPFLFAIPENVTTLHSAANANNYNQIWEEIKKNIHSTKRCSTKSSCKKMVFDVFDSIGKTSLMISVEKNYTKSSMYLLLGGSDPNIKHMVNGNTALHYAVMSGHSVMVKLLLMSGADPMIQNDNNETALDLAKKTKGKELTLIIKELEEIISLKEKSRKYFEKNNIAPMPRYSSDTFLLSMDGGGIRCIIVLLVLMYIEFRMHQLSSTAPMLMSYFDYIAGTSAGSIIGLLLAYTGVSLKEALAMSYKAVTDVFEKPLSERGEDMAHYLQELFGEDTVMSDLEEGKRIVITSTLADRNPSQLHLMTNYGAPRDGQKGPTERKVWEAARMSSAGPTYFPAFENKFLDGGLMSNNPTVDAMVEIFQQGKIEKKQVKLGLVLSVGSGISPVKKMATVGDVFMPGWSIKSVTSLPDAARSLSSLFDLLVSEATQSDGQQILRAETWCDSVDAAYYRFSPSLYDDISPATTSINVIVDMMYCTTKYLLSIPDKIDAVAKVILSK